jgi:hydroxyethylthiazole kinase-like uncharacterized protein yjeF
MKLFSSQELKEWDAFTMQQEPIASIDLMERAATACMPHIFPYAIAARHIYILCGLGNNGGDGLAIARLLSVANMHTKVITVFNESAPSADCKTNLARLQGNKLVNIIELKQQQQLPNFNRFDLVIDCLFGYGLNKPVSGIFKEVIEKVNASAATVISIDMPSGLPADVLQPQAVKDYTVVQAQHTLTFQTLKHSLLFAETGSYAGKVQVIPIGMHQGFEGHAHAHMELISTELVQSIIKPRQTFAHKGTHGHVMLAGGSYGKMGAAVLMAKGALYSGCGLLHAYVPKVGYTILQTALPEAIVMTDDEFYEIRHFPNLQGCTAAGIGPGMGMHAETIKMLGAHLPSIQIPVVLDADALNCCSTLLQEHHFSFRFPKQCILTPHPKEFDRLAGFSSNSFERQQKAHAFAQIHDVVVVLKGAYTRICLPDGRMFVNTSGNSAMATGGSGDVLTGLVASLLAQGYSVNDAAIAGVFIHGLAGDIAAKGKFAISASEIASAISPAMHSLL